MADRFEYKLVQANVEHNKGRELESSLNELGREGWQVVSHAVAGASLYSVILKRALG